MASRHGVTYPPGLTCYPSARSVHASEGRSDVHYEVSVRPPFLPDPESRRVGDKAWFIGRIRNRYFLFGIADR